MVSMSCKQESRTATQWNKSRSNELLSFHYISEPTVVRLDARPARFPPRIEPRPNSALVLMQSEHCNLLCFSEPQARITQSHAVEKTRVKDLLSFLYISEPNGMSLGCYSRVVPAQDQASPEFQ